MNAGMVMYDEEFRQVQGLCARLQRDSNAKAVLLIDKNGQAIAEAGETQTLDVTSLASLTAGNVATTGGIAKLLEEPEFAGAFHEGRSTHVMLHVVMERLILIVIFDHRSSQGLVKLRVRKAQEELGRIFETMMRKSEAGSQSAPAGIAEITDDDIENLFRD
ncbi:MAG: roadblock/LC7 domain-containing protein [Myxococcota bacterium]